MIPKWPDSLEVFHIPPSLDTLYLPFFENAPASLKGLVIENGVRIYVGVLNTIFGLIGSRILTLKVEFEGVRDEIANTFIKLPHLLQLRVRPGLIRSFIRYARSDPTYLTMHHPLRSLTIYLNQLDYIFHTTLLNSLEDLLKVEWLPSIRTLQLSDKLTDDRWVSFLNYKLLPQQHVMLLYFGRILKLRDSTASSIGDCGVWLMSGEDNDATIWEFTKENLVRAMCTTE